MSLKSPNPSELKQPAQIHTSIRNQHNLRNQSKKIFETGPNPNKLTHQTELTKVDLFDQCNLIVKNLNLKERRSAQVFEALSLLLNIL